MRDLSADILELIRRAATRLPPDVEAALRAALGREEPGSAAFNALEMILQNVDLARRQSLPICQDTGTPHFYICAPESWSRGELARQVRAAVAEATRRSHLRPNAVHPFSGRNSGDNLGDEFFPAIHFEDGGTQDVRIDLLLKGGGCENVGAQYALPDGRLGAGRDLEGVRRAALHAVWRAQGEGCAPGFLSIAVGGDRGSGAELARRALLDRLDEPNPDPQLAALEERITREANQLGIGPMGFGGRSTLLGTRIRGAARLPASYFVTISYMCWAYRRCRMTAAGGEVAYD